MFNWLAATGGVGEQEMLRTFNCGIGMIAVVDARLRRARSPRFSSAMARRVVRLGELVAAARRTARDAFTGHLDLRMNAMARKRVAILISGRGSNMAALIEAAKRQDYPAEIALVVSNRRDAAGLDRARRPKASRRQSSTTRKFGKDREAFERALAGRIRRRTGSISSALPASCGF